MLLQAFLPPVFTQITMIWVLKETTTQREKLTCFTKSLLFSSCLIRVTTTREAQGNLRGFLGNPLQSQRRRHKASTTKEIIDKTLKAKTQRLFPYGFTHASSSSLFFPCMTIIQVTTHRWNTTAVQRSKPISPRCH